MNIQMIPLNRLTPSPANVRKTGGTSIDDLAASIAAHGLLQNLQVRPASKGKYEVVAGGRRLKALNLLASRKTIGKSFEVACKLLEDADAVEVSLAENVIREPMHPADQFDAFQAMVADGKGVEDIAARFGCAVSTVKQRLKLGSVNPALITLYRDEEISLDQLMAFTVSDDTEAQLECWQSLPEWNRHPRTIRAALLAAHVSYDDPRVDFVGIDAYLAAGGNVIRDLFHEEHQGYLADAALLERLVAERLEREAESIRAEGWAWVDIHPDEDFDRFGGCDFIEGEEVPLTKAEQKELRRIEKESDALAEGDETPETEAQYDRLQKRIRELTHDRLRTWTEAEKTRAGAFVSVGDDGELCITRGILRDGTAKEDTGPEHETTGKPTPKQKGLSAALTEELTAHRTAALQVMVARNVPVALAALAGTMALPVFYGDGGDMSLCVRVTRFDVAYRARGVGLKDAKAVTAFAAILSEWSERLPPDPEGLADWLAAQGLETCIALMAVCTAASLNAVHSGDGRGERRIAHADSLAAKVGLDMADWWQPTADTYFGRVSKALTLDAVTEAKSKQAADNIAGLKKDQLVARAEKIVSGTGWLPTLLRNPS